MLAVFVATAFLAAPSWARVSETGPEGRYQPGMVYDTARHLTVMFGGVNATTGLFGDTWGWDGKSWRQLANRGPSPRSVPNIAYDSHRKRIVLFGGYTVPRLMGDTWEWNGRRWQEMHAKGPSARDGSATAYDPLHRVVVMFGGSTIWGNHGSTSETWLWNGRRWRIATMKGPAPRMYSQMAYDAASRKIVLLGGCDDSGKLFQDTWTWNGRNWKEEKTAPLPRAEHRMAFIDRLRGVVAYAGVSLPEPAPDSGDYVEGMTLWRASRWVEVPSKDDTPGARRAPGMAYDSRRHKLVLFGGEMPSRSRRFLRDTWEWSP